jgi:TolB-like protein
MTLPAQILEAQNQTPIPAASPETWTHDEVREELDRILKSRFFIKSIRLSCFLSTAVDYLLEGKAHSFKEYTVGTDVYKRSATYDPTVDTIVRTEARRLRTKLKEYYSSFPEQHRVRIALKTGSYVPVIEMRYSSRFEGRHEVATPSISPFHGYLSIAVIPFSAKITEPTVQNIACNLEEELTHELATVPNIKVFRSPVGGWANPVEQFCSWDRSGVQFALHGHMHQSPEAAVMQIQLTTMQGMILWSGRFSCESLQSQSSEIAFTVRAAILASTMLGDRSMVRELTLSS